MYNMFVHCSLIGDSFSPKKLEEKLKVKLDLKNETGDFGEIGRFKDKPIPYGGAILRAPDINKDENANAELTWFLNHLPAYMPSFLSTGATEVVLHVDVFYENECNLQFNPVELKKIADLEIVFTISCIEVDDSGS